MSILSAKQAYAEALNEIPSSNMNSLHERVYSFLQKQQQKYYEDKVDAFLSTLKLSSRTKTMLRRKLLQPVTVGGVHYANFMEEAAKRLNQSTKTTSGRVAEWCVQRELEKNSLRKNEHFTIRKDKTDIIVYHPDMKRDKKRHRIEVKNLKMRERGIRGLVYDGDSLVGFFDEESEFGAGTVKEINEYCRKTNGYAYVSPLIYNSLRKNKQLTRNARFKLNTEIGKDMAKFCKTGKL
jgi:transposase